MRINLFKRRWLRWLVYAILIIILVGAGGLVAWATIRAQEATERAVKVLNDNGIEREKGLLVFRPNTTTDRGLIYYPGGLVDPEAYAVTAQGIADAGYLVVIPKMPLNLAFMGINRANEIMEKHPQITTWAIGGHSLGGAMAAQYAKNNEEKIAGLIMYASYPAKNEDFVDFQKPILTIISTEDPGAPKQEAFYQAIPKTAQVTVIEGGNHRQYGDYSYQKNDDIATITVEKQQDQIIAATIKFLDNIKQTIRASSLIKSDQSKKTHLQNQNLIIPGIIECIRTQSNTPPDHTASQPHTSPIRTRPASRWMETKNTQ